MGSRMVRVDDRLYREAKKLQQDLREVGVIITMEDACYRAKKKRNDRPDWWGRFDLK